MGKFIDLTGQKFGKLTVVKRIENYIQPNGSIKTQWLCKCECGNETIVKSDMLKSGNTRSCGCIKNNNIKNGIHSTHKLSHTRIYNLYMGIKARCYNSNEPAYKNYGGRGIKMCKEWFDDFMSFYNWATDSGYKDNLTIDRIDVNGNYEPSNCRWVDMKIQQNNRSNNHRIKYNGETKTLMEWSKDFGVNYKTLHKRVSDGWNIEDALTKPIEKYHVKYKGESKTVREWCETLNLNHETVKSRLKRGWLIERALETPTK